MAGFFKATERLSHHLNAVVRQFTAILIAIQTGMILYGVFFRYILDDPLPWVLPISKMLLIWIGLLGITIGFKDLEHVSMKGLVYKLPEQAQVVCFLITYFLIFVFLAAVVIKGFPIALTARELIMVSAKIHIPRVWTMLAVPVFALINIIHLLNIPQLLLLERAERDRILSMK